MSRDRDLNRLMRRIKSLTPNEIARVQQFLTQMRSPGSPELRVVPVELKTVTAETVTVAATDGESDPNPPRLADGPEAATAGPAVPRPPAPTANESGRRLDLAPAARSHTAADADDPSAVWRRRPFQAIDDCDLEPIAALFREAVDTRAAVRQRFGA
ncbi:MAG: hypothetical protein AB7G13_17380 [Lautropia sp.]